MDEDDRDWFRGAGPCELCQVWCRARVPHHAYHRGMGAGHELNLKINLIAVGAPLTCDCHQKIHDANIIRANVLEVIAKREGILPDLIWELILWHLMPEHCRPERPVVNPKRAQLGEEIPF